MELSVFKILAVGAGGFLGASSRFILSVTLDQRFSESGFPVGTFVVNMIGCLLIGLLIATLEHKNWLDANLRLFLITGILGGFTTFSAFAHDSFLLFQEQQFVSGLVNAGGQIIVGLFMVWMGYKLVGLFV